MKTCTLVFALVTLLDSAMAHNFAILRGTPGLDPSNYAAMGAPSLKTEYECRQACLDDCALYTYEGDLCQLYKETSTPSGAVLFNSGIASAGFARTDCSDSRIPQQYANDAGSVICDVGSCLPPSPPPPPPPAVSMSRRRQARRALREQAAKQGPRGMRRRQNAARKK